MYYSGNDVNKDYKKSFDWYMKASEQNDGYGHFCVADMYYFGEGVKENHEEALKWYIKSAETYDSDGRAEYKISKMYKNGEGVKQNDEEALKWLIKATKNSDENKWDDNDNDELANESYYVDNIDDFDITSDMIATTLWNSIAYKSIKERINFMLTFYEQQETIKKLNQLIDELQMRITYQPDGIGYQIAMNNFNKKIKKPVLIRSKSK